MTLLAHLYPVWKLHFSSSKGGFTAVIVPSFVPVLSHLAGTESHSPTAWGRGLCSHLSKAAVIKVPSFSHKEMGWDLRAVARVRGWAGVVVPHRWGSTPAGSAVLFVPLQSVGTCPTAMTCSSDLSLCLILVCLLWGELKNEIIFQEFSP